MIWVKFESIEQFNAWHNEIKIALNLPKPSTNLEGEIVPDAIETKDYVQPIIVAENDVRAFIDETFSQDLILSENPYPSNYNG